MSSFAIRNPYFIIVICLVIGIVGTTVLLRMPVDLFPTINIPVVVVATFYSGMPPEQIETDITGSFERFFTLGSNIDHIESRSLPGCQPDQDLFSAGNRCRRRLERDLQSGHGRLEEASAGNIAAGGAEIRCLQSARLPDHP